MLLLAGVVLGGLARTGATVATDGHAAAAGAGREVAVVSVFAITAAAQVAVSTAILMVFVILLLGAAGATFALAFGLGGREVARELSAGAT